MKSLMNKLIPILIGKYINLLSFIVPKLAGQKAFELFCTPRKGKVRPRDQTFLDQADAQQIIDTPIGKIHSYIWNQTGERTVLLLHGWESNSARWRFLIPLLTNRNFRVVCIDAPAHGKSEGKLFHMPKYAEAIRSAVLSFQPEYVIGHSIGGTALTYYLSHFPQPGIEKFILMGTPSDLLDFIQHFKNMLSLSARSVQSISTHMEKIFNRPPEYFSMKNFCSTIEIPALIIHDKDDPIARVEDGFQFNENLAHSQLMITHQFGHSLQNKLVYTKIIEFLEEEVLINMSHANQGLN